MSGGVLPRSFEELDAAGPRAKGRIILFNALFTNYGETVQYRSTGPSRAAALGAVASLARSVGPAGLRLPHTGALRYADGTPQVPAAAITTEDADFLQRMQDRGTTVRVRLKMDANILPEADSFNVIGEIRGREKPDEVVVVGGHIDSWDVGTGSTDDGGGCVVTWEALRLMKKLNLRPRRTVRVVLWTNEENGTRGALAYRDRYKDQLSNHVLMLESDSGILRPTRSASPATTPPDAHQGSPPCCAAFGGSDRADRWEADIGPSAQAGNIPSMSLDGSGNYFLITTLPLTRSTDRSEWTCRASAAIAVIAYVVARVRND